MFPDNIQVIEGEEVAFRVKVTGVPWPRITWYHNGEEVVADYSKELEEDGSLIIPTSEFKHSGEYQLVAINKAGSVKKQVSLFVQRQGQQPVNVAKKQIFSPPISVDEFAEYVSKCHANDNKNFRDQYTVRASACGNMPHIPFPHFY